jgi:hypothetical protein
MRGLHGEDRRALDSASGHHGCRGLSDLADAGAVSRRYRMVGGAGHPFLSGTQAYPSASG